MRFPNVKEFKNDKLSKMVEAFVSEKYGFWKKFIMVLFIERPCPTIPNTLKKVFLAKVLEMLKNDV